MEELQKLEELNNLLTSALSEYKKRGQDYDINNDDLPF